MNPEQAHRNMIQNQIRAGGVLSQDIIETLLAVRREFFVPSSWRSLSYADIEIPLPCSENMLTPRMEALILEKANIRPSDHVLEIGTGSGYMAALLGHRAFKVTSVEIEPELAEMAQQNLQKQGTGNVEIIIGDGARGWGTENMLYDVIVISGGLTRVSERFYDALRLNGRLIAFVGSQSFYTARLTQRISDTEYHTAPWLETSIKPLRGQETVSGFYW